MPVYSQSRQHREAGGTIFDQVFNGIMMHYRMKGKGGVSLAQGRMKTVASATCRAGSNLSLHINLLDLRI